MEKRYRKDFNDRMNEYVVVANVSASMTSIATDQKVKGLLWQPKEKKRLLIGDLITVAHSAEQIAGVNRDGVGAVLYIEDAQFREHLGFESYDDEGKLIEPQKTFSIEFIKEMLMHKNEKLFQKFIKDNSRDFGRRKMLYTIADGLDDLTNSRMKTINDTFRLN